MRYCFLKRQDGDNSQPHQEYNMNKFKFFSGTKLHYVPIQTNDTNTTYHIPIDLYGHILELAVDLHRENMVLFSPVEYRIENEIGLGVSYFYKIDEIKQYLNIPNRIIIYYGIKFPDTEYYYNFITSENINLYV